MCAAAAAISFKPSLGEDAVQVALAPGLLEEIRDRVLDGYAAAPHGGVEVGFVLLGRNTDKGAVIEHFREIPCAHLLSPRFLLSPEEEKRFPDWIKVLSTDPELKGAKLLGWCCSHHRSEITLLDREIAFHHRYFRQPNQLLMVVKPQNMQAVVAGIFVPDERGVLNAETPAFRLRSAFLDSVFDSKSKTPEERQPKIVKPLPVAERLGGSRTRMGKRFRISGRWVGSMAGTAVLTAFLALALTGGFYFLGAKASSPSLSVAIRPQGDDLVFTWNGTIDRVKSADIEILDGAATSRFNITRSFQRAGVFVFPHRTGNVQVVLTARTKDQKMVRSIGFADGRPRVDDQNRARSETAGSAAARLEATNRRLAALVSILQSRWKPSRK